MINQWLIIFCYFHEVLIPQTIHLQVIGILTDNLRHWMKLIFICLMSSYHELLYFHTPIDIRSRLRGYYKNWSVSADYLPYLLPLLHFVCHNSSRPFSLTNEFDFVRVVCWCCSCFCYRTWCCCTSNYRCIHFAILATSKDIILSCSDSFHLKYFTIDAKLAEGSFTHIDDMTHERGKKPTVIFPRSHVKVMLFLPNNKKANLPRWDSTFLLPQLLSYKRCYSRLKASTFVVYCTVDYTLH